MCIPDPDEIDLLKQQAVIMDSVLDIILTPKPKPPRECEECGTIYIPRMTDGHYVCQECRFEKASAAIESGYERAHGRGPI